jgi:ankyrin repeat protein
VRLLLEFGASPESREWFELSRLVEGARHPAVVALLLENGANPNVCGAGSLLNPLGRAARARNVESLRLMLASGGNASRVDSSGSVLQFALGPTDAECCRELLAHGADPYGRPFGTWAVTRRCTSSRGTPDTGAHPSS